MNCFYYTCQCLLIFVCLFTFAATEDECELPENKKGKCMELSACDPYLVLLKESTTTELGLRTVQETRCGVAGINIKVCCPVESVVATRTNDNLDEEDYVDELPTLDSCGRLKTSSVPYVWDGKPVKTHAPSGELFSGYSQGSSANDQQYSSTPSPPPFPSVFELPPPVPSEAYINNFGSPNYGIRPMLPPLPSTIEAKSWIDQVGPETSSQPTNVHSGTSMKIGHGKGFNQFSPLGVPSAWGGAPVVGYGAVRGSGTSYNHPPPSITGGQPVRKREMAQWMALLAYNSTSDASWECGGSVITKKHVLTAAHCIRKSLFVVRVGELDLAATKKEFHPIDYRIKKKIRHENYTKFHNDIGILIVEGTIPIGDPNVSRYIAPVCLPEWGFPYEKYGPASTFITGWGETEHLNRPTNLLYAYLDIIDQEECKRTYADEALTIDERVFCAGDRNNGRDACNGDSGGPLIGKYYVPDYYGVFYYQIGLISFGYRCDSKRFTGVYTNVTHFMPWIQEKVTGKKEPRQWTRTTVAPIVYDPIPSRPYSDDMGAPFPPFPLSGNPGVAPVGY